MRRTGAWVAVLACVAAAGCPGWPGLPGRTPSAADPARARSFSPGGFPLTPAAEGLYVESVLLEGPAGDAFLDRDLWAAARSPLPHETDVLLAENGLRVLTLGGNLPPAFAKRLESEADTVNPHALTFANRKDAVVPTAGPLDPCEYDVLPDLAGGRAAVTLRQARCGVMVRPERTADGRVKLWCEPQLQHGEKADWWRPTSDATGFTKAAEVPLERYPGLGFCVVLRPEDYLVIGAPAAADRTLGTTLFAAEANGQPRQRVLVVRTGWRGDRPAVGSAGPVRGRPSIAAEAANW